MSVEALVCLEKELPVKAYLTAAGFVACKKQNRLTSRVESEGDSPYAICCIESQFFHVGVSGAFERVCSRSSQLRPKLLKQTCQCEDFLLNGLRQGEELRFKFVADEDGPHLVNIR